MTTVLLNIPDKKENLFMTLFKKHHLRMRVLKDDDDEDAMAKWIDEGMKSEDVSEKEIFDIFKKHGIKV